MRRAITCVLLILLLQGDSNKYLSAGQQPKLPLSPQPAPGANGIFVDAPKMYDDQSLEHMLDAARAQLASIRALDQGGITARIGTMQGASAQTSSFGLQVGGPPIPGAVTTANTGNAVNTQTAATGAQQNTGATVSTQSSGTNAQQNRGATGTAQTSGSNTQTTNGTTDSTQNVNSTTTQLQVTGPSTVSTNTTNNQSVVTGPGIQTVTTQAAMAPTAATLPTSTPFSLPSTFSPSASDVLNEQMQLTYEIAGYQLMLEGPLSDHYMRVSVGGQVGQLIRQRATFGIPISITSSKQYEDSVAEVILEVTTTPARLVDEAPAIAALMPREKTYNAAAISNKMVSLGGGVVTHVLSAGVSGLWGHQTYYVVQDQDTLALQLPPDPAKPETVRFGWQFRPVLGQKAVRSGTRQVFVQLAFPVQPIAQSFGSVQVLTQWKKYDRKKGIVASKPINGSVSISPTTFDLPNFNLEPSIQSSPEIEDGGNGLLTVLVKGNYLAGTGVRIGSTTMVPGNGTVAVDPSGIRFIAPAIQLATQKAYLVDRSGEESEILEPFMVQSPGDKCFSVTNDPPVFVSSTTALINIKVTFANEFNCGQMEDQTTKQPHPSARTTDLIVVVGNRVFGLRDSPMQSRSDDTLSFFVQSDLVRTAPHLVVERPFWGARFMVGLDVHLKPTTLIEKAVSISQTSAEVDIALIGSGLTGLAPVVPARASIRFASDIGAVIAVPTSEVKNLKQLVLKGSSGELLLIAMPTEPGTPPGTPQLRPTTPVMAGKPITITVQGTNLDTLQSVKYLGKDLHIVKHDKSSVTVDLPASVTAKAGTSELEFVFQKSQRVTYPIPVFDQKIDTSPPSQPK